MPQTKIENNRKIFVIPTTGVSDPGYFTNVQPNGFVYIRKEDSKLKNLKESGLDYELADKDSVEANHENGNEIECLEYVKAAAVAAGSKLTRKERKSVYKGLSKNIIPIRNMNEVEKRPNLSVDHVNLDKHLKDNINRLIDIKCHNESINTDDNSGLKVVEPITEGSERKLCAGLVEYPITNSKRNSIEHKSDSNGIAVWPVNVLGKRKLHKSYMTSWNAQIMCCGYAKCLIETCNFITRDLSTMQEHYKTCNGVQNFDTNLCRTCNSWLSSEEELNAHVIECKKSKDSSGKKQMTEMNLVLKPEMLGEESLVEGTSTETEGTKYCDHCDQDFSSDAEYSRHAAGCKKNRKSALVGKKRDPNMRVSRMLKRCDDLDENCIIQPGRDIPKEQYVRRRAYTKQHKSTWEAAIRKFKHVKCIFQNCHFLALSVEDMISHFGYCNGDGSYAKFVCPFCEGRVTSKRYLEIHIRRSHQFDGYDAGHFMEMPEESRSPRSDSNDFPSYCEGVEEIGETSLEPAGEESILPDVGTKVEDVQKVDPNREDHIYFKKCNYKGKAASSLLVMKNSSNSRHYSGPRNGSERLKKDEEEEDFQKSSEQFVGGLEKYQTEEVQSIGQDDTGKYVRQKIKFSFPCIQTTKRKIQKFYTNTWLESIKTNGFARCLVATCNFISLDIYHIQNHFKTCDGVPANGPNLCSLCKSWLPSGVELSIHSTKCKANGDMDFSATHPIDEVADVEEAEEGEDEDWSMPASYDSQLKDPLDLQSNPNEGNEASNLISCDVCHGKFLSESGMANHVCCNIENDLKPGVIKKPKLPALRISDLIKLKDSEQMDANRIVQQGPDLPKGQYLRRRAYTKQHKAVWEKTLEKLKYVKCIFQNCHFLAMSLEDMIYHFGYCIGDGSFAKFECPHCGGRLTTKEILNIHLQRSHSELITDPGRSEDTPESSSDDIISGLDDMKKIVTPKEIKTYGKSKKPVKTVEVPDGVKSTETAGAKREDRLSDSPTEPLNEMESSSDQCAMPEKTRILKGETVVGKESDGKENDGKTNGGDCPRRSTRGKRSKSVTENRNFEESGGESCSKKRQKQGDDEPPEKNGKDKPNERVGRKRGRRSRGKDDEEEKEKSGNAEEEPEVVPKPKRGRRLKVEPVEDTEQTTQDSLPEEVKCALCEFRDKSDKFSNHNYRKHFGLGWIEGETPLDMNDEAILSWNVKQAFKVVKLATCAICGSVKKSALGFISHVQNCGKSQEEKEALKVQCPHCPSKVLKYSLPMHLKLSHSEPTEEPENARKDKSEEYLNALPSKRRSALHAASKFQEVLKECGEEEEERKKSNYVFYEKGVSKLPALPHKIKGLWLKLKRENKKIPCRRGSCLVESSNIQEAKKHHFLCSELPEKVFVCQLCDYYSAAESDVQQHVSIHPKGDSDFAAGSEEDKIDDDNTETREEVEPEELIVDGEEAALRNTFMRRERILNERKMRFFRQCLQMTLSSELEDERSGGTIWPNLRTEAEDWIPVSAKDVSHHLPSLEESMSIHLNQGRKTDPPVWRRYQRFESDVCEGLSLIFTGGRVLSMSWCKVSYQRSEDKSTRQYLAVSCSGRMDKFHEIHEPVDGTSGLIQIWDCGSLKTSTKTIEVPKLALGIVHDSGEVWDLSWYPLDGYLPREKISYLTRIGLLIGACQDGTVRVWSVCDPAELENGFGLPLYKVEPRMVLVTEEESKVGCLRLSIGREGVVVGGYANGIVAVWHLKNLESPFCRKSGKSTILKPHLSFQAHRTSITALSICPNSDRYIMTSGLDRFVKFWDLDCVSSPVESVHKEVCLDNVWPKHWPLTASTFEDVTPCLGKGMMKSIRDAYCYKHRDPLGMDSTCWSLSFNEWMNIICGCNNDGEVKMRYMLNLFLVEEKFRKGTDHTLSTSDLKLLIEEEKYKAVDSSIVKEESKPSGSKGSRKAKKPEASSPVPTTYDEANQYFGLVINDFGFDQETRKECTAKKKSNILSVEEYPITSVNKVCWNPNFDSFTFLAIGHNCGLIRIRNLNDRMCDYELNRFLKNPSSMTT